MKSLFTFFLLVSVSTLSISQTKYLTLEPNHSTLGFVVDIAGGMTKVTGKFTSADLKLSYVDEDWTKSHVEITIDVNSINTGIEDRDNHLKSSDFFDEEQYPKITFKSHKIIEKGNNTFEASGTFTMHGIDAEISFPFEVTGVDGNNVGIHLNTKIDRIHHKVGHEFVHTAIENFLSDLVEVDFYFWTKRDKRFSKESK